MHLYGTWQRPGGSVGHYHTHELKTHQLRTTARMPRRNTKGALAPEDVDSYVKWLSKVVVRMTKHNNNNGRAHDLLPIPALLHFGVLSTTVRVKCGPISQAAASTKTRAIGVRSFSRGLSDWLPCISRTCRTMHAIMSIATLGRALR